MDKIQLQLLISQNKTIKDMALALNCSTETIKRKLKLFDITLPEHLKVKPGRSKGSAWTPEQRGKLLKSRKEAPPFKGKKHSDESKQKMSENHADFTGDKNPYSKSLEDPEKRKEASKRAKKIWKNRTHEQIEARNTKLSRSMAEADQHNIINTNNLQGFIESKKAGKVFYRSGWEKWIIEQLDEIPEVNSFTLEEIVIDYTNNLGKKRSTRCDFVIKTKDKMFMFECKPKRLKFIQNNLEKSWAYQEYCKQNGLIFRTVDEDIIYNTGKFRLLFL